MFYVLWLEGDSNQSVIPFVTSACVDLIVMEHYQTEKAASTADFMGYISWQMDLTGKMRLWSTGFGIVITN